MEINYIELGKKIKLFREERNITQDDLCSALNISKAYLSRIEAGTAKVTLPMFVGIANGENRLESTNSTELLKRHLQANHIFEKILQLSASTF